MSERSRCRWSLQLAVVLAFAGAGLGAAPAPAAEGDAAPTPAWLAGLTLDGFLASSYSYNFNRPDSRTNQLRVFDFADNTFKLDLFELVLQRTTAKPGEAGFRVDLALGSSVPRVSSARGLFRTETTTEDIDLQQAYASLIAPLGSGLRFDIGKFVTPAGFEVIEGYDNWNDNATRSLLFGYAIPFTHTGVRATYGFSKRVTGLLMVVNGWDVAEDNNRSKTVGGQLMLTPASSFTIALTGMTGPERTGADGAGDARTVLDGSALWKVAEHFTLGANGDLGNEPHAAAAGADARWSGLAIYARGTSGSLALSLRAEAFDDRDGARTGTAQKVDEFTLTPEARLAPHLLLRSDLRVDRSDHPVFEKGAGHTDTQPTILLNLLYDF